MRGAAVVARIATLAACVNRITGDLPIHCLAEDIFGDWEIISDGAPLTELSGCGHALPNSVPSMLSLVGEKERMRPLGEQKERFVVTLTDRVLPSANGGDATLVAIGPAGEQGSWTMVYDEGFEVRLDERRYTAKFEFEVLPWKTSQEGDLLDKIGKYYYRAKGHSWKDFPDPVYGVHCGQTSPGWFSKPRQDATGSGGRFNHGCFVGKKLETQSQPNVSAGFFTLGHQARAAHTADPSNPPPLPFASLVWVNATGPGKAFVRADGREEVMSPPAIHEVLPPLPTKQASFLHAKKAAAARSLPENWDWREAPELQNFKTSGIDVLSNQTDQGGCGSCYVFAAATQLGMRFRIELAKKGHKVPMDLSWRAFTGCSPMSEGCKGGWPYFVGRIAREEGMFQVTTSTDVPKDGCMADQSPTDIGERCLPNCAHASLMADRQPVWYAKEYGYVGGFERGATEEGMMRELYEHGPVTLELATKAVAHFVYGVEGRSEVMETFDNGMLISDGVDAAAVQPVVAGNISSSKTSEVELNEWMWVDHVIVGVGWGTTQVSSSVGTWLLANKKQASLLARGVGIDNGQVKHWVVRNSWSKYWGNGGYAKLVRGVNAGGVEMSCAWISPDVDRIPAQYLAASGR